MKRFALLLSLVVAALMFVPTNAHAKSKKHKHDKHHHHDRCDYGGRYYGGYGNRYYGYRPSYNYYRPTYYRSSYYRPTYYAPYRSYYSNGYCAPYRRPSFSVAFGF